MCGGDSRILVMAARLVFPPHLQVAEFLLLRA